MKSFFRILTAVCVIVGSIIGAGFATGKELHIYFFGGNVWLVAINCFALFFSTIIIIFLSKKLGAHSPQGLFSVLFGRFSYIFEFAMCFCYFLVISTMIAGGNLCLSELFGIDEKTQIFGILTAIISCVIMLKDLRGLKVLNLVAVPLIVLFIVLLCKEEGDYCGTGGKALSALMYVSFNTVMMIGVLLTLGQSLNIKESCLCTFIASLLIVTLMVLILYRLNDKVYNYVPMPLISISKAKNTVFYYFASLTLYLSILTSMSGCALPVYNRLNSIMHNKYLSVGLIGFFGLIFSFFGFENIIAYAYPIVSCFGVIIFVMIVVKLLLHSNANERLFPARQLIHTSAQPEHTKR